MKKILVVLPLLISSYCFGQKAIKDEAVHAQERRQVYQKWGDWRPKAKHILGVQVNPLHTLVWGWAAPSTNRKYKSGRDIRPLAPTGKQNLRLAALSQQKAITDKILEDANEIGKMAEKEILYYTNTTAKLDPLYLIYFQKTLKPVTEFQQSNLFSECGRADIYNFLKETGVINSHTLQMNILKDRLSGLFSTNIERGQRIIMYHRILADYRSEKNTWDRHISSTRTFLDMKAKNAYKDPTLPNKNDPFNGTQENRDRQIASQIIEEARYNNMFK